MSAEDRRFHLFCLSFLGRSMGLDSEGVLCGKDQPRAHERAVQALIDADEALRVYETHPSPIFPEMEPSA